MINKKKYFNFIYSFFVVLVITSFISSALTSIISASNDNSLCQQGQDLVIQVAPFGCSPLRSDLLKDQDVTVYCKIQAMKINPLIDVKSIDSINFINPKYSSQISSVSFFSANAASGNKEVLTSSLFNDIGYIAVKIKQQTNSSLMPNLVEGNLTADVKYNVEDSFGIGKGLFYLPLLEEEDWESQKDVFSFWNNAGYLRLENSDSEKAEISIYSSQDKISTITLKKGETSNKISLPTFKCGAGLKLKLQDLNVMTTRAKIKVDSELVEVAKGEKFLNNKCEVKEIINNGLSKSVSISCKDKEGSKSFSLSISPKIDLSIDGTIKTVELGDYLYSSNNKKIYLIYVGGKEGDLNTNENLILFLAALPKSNENRLSISELSSFASLLNELKNEDLDSDGILSGTSKLLEKFGNRITLFTRLIGKGESIQKLVFDGDQKPRNYYNKEIFIASISGPQDKEIEDEIKESYYKNSKEDYQSLIDKFTSEIYGSEGTDEQITYGEKALRNQIILASSGNQKATLLELCDNFKKEYPSKKINECSENKISNGGVSETYLTIDGENRQISFEGVYEPTFKDYGVTIRVTYHSSGEVEDYQLTRDKTVSFKGLNGYMILRSINEDSANIFFNFDNSLMKIMRKDLDLSSGDIATFKKEVSKSSESGGYTFEVIGISLTKSAKISLIPEAGNFGTKSNFSFQIEIENRSIKLSPEMTNKSIAKLDGLISTFGNISKGLNTWVEVQKGACYATAGLLAANSFLSGNIGANTARQSVMRGIGGWFEKCNSMVQQGKYISSSACLLNNSKEIDQEVESLSKSIESQNKQIEALELQVSPNNAKTNQVNTSAFMEKYCVKVQTLIKTLSQDQLTLIGISINDAELLSYTNWKRSRFTLDQLKNIELYSNILKNDSSNEQLNKLAIAELKSIFLLVKDNSKLEEASGSFFSRYGFEEGSVQDLSRNKKIIIYKIKSASEIKQFSALFNSLSDEDYVYPIYDLKDKKQYIIVIDSVTHNIKTTYFISETNQISVEGSDSKANPLSLTIEFYAKYSYNNIYKTPELKYYDSDPYKGLPALVPVDTKEGWYAAIKQTTSLLGDVASYDESGDVKNFYLGNVGANGKQEFEINGGDDIYKGINLNAPNPFSFPGLTDSRAREIILKAKEAILQAEKIPESKRTGKVKINNEEVSVGNAAVSSMTLSCEDLMSPEQCTLLFNVCDPVICPTSRCNLGGLRKDVKNVNQEGILGGLFLCLPNFVGFGGNVIIPVCVDGVKVGIDNLVSVFKDARNCLQKSLDTGETVGICDELQSIYLCDILWKETKPFVESIGTNLLGSIFGMNSKGGGEYSELSERVSSAKSALTFFLNSYSSNSQKAFLSRATETITSEFCKSFVSGVYPSASELLSQIVKSDSPVQFSGHFDEMLFTSATVPAMSHYKIFYHIYAGQNSVAYYSIYLKGDDDSTSNPDKVIDSGSIAIGDSLTETKDITAPAGYKKLCINVNGQEECGFKQVSTSFALNTINDLYIATQVNQTDITTEKECTSGTILSYGVGIYNKGIIRVCSTDNPGMTTDVNIGTENSRWKDVGYCGNTNLRCWIDSESVKDVIKLTDLEKEAIGEITASDLAALGLSGDYLTSASEIESKLSEITNEKDLKKKISLIDLIIDKVILIKYKTKLLLLRGDIYRELFGQKITPPPVTESDSSVEEIKGCGEFQCCYPEGMWDGLDNVRKAILRSAEILNKTDASRCISPWFSDIDKTKRSCIFKSEDSCWNGAIYIYQQAVYNNKKGIGTRAFFTDYSGKEYTFLNDKVGDGKQKTIKISTDWKTDFNVDATLSNWQHNSQEESYNTEEEKLNSLRPGDLLSLVWNDHSGHNLIFIYWVNKEKHIAKLFDWNNNTCIEENGKTVYQKNGDCFFEKKFRYFEWDISDNSHPVYQIWQPAGSDLSDEDSTKPTGNPNPLGDEGNSTTRAQSIPESSQVNSNLADKTEEEVLKQSEGFMSTLSYADLLEKSGIKTNDNKNCGKNIVNTESLAICLRSDPNFHRISPSYLEEGDIIVLGKNCNKDAISGILKGINKKENNLFEITYYYAIPDTSTTANSFQSITETIYLNNIDTKTNYLHAAYRYLNDDKGDYFEEYTNSQAISDLKSYSENTKISSNTQVKSIFDRLVISDSFSSAQCSMGKDKDVKWLREELGVSELLEIDFASNKDYYEINLKNLKVGDIILLRKECSLDNSVVGKITSIGTSDSQGRKIIKYNWKPSIDSKIKEGTVNLIMEILTGGEYIYKAYRPISEKKVMETLRTPWNKQTAYQKLSVWTTSSSENNTDYSDLLYSNSKIKSTVDEFIIDGLFTEEECQKIRGGTYLSENLGFLGTITDILVGAFSGGMKVKEIKQILYSSREDQTSSSNSEKLLDHLKTAASQGKITSISQILYDSGFVISQNYQDENLFSFVTNRDYFYEITPENVLVGDLFLIGKGCQLKQKIGIVKSVDKTNIEYYYLDDNDKIFTLKMDTEKIISSAYYPYAFYRYVASFTSDQKESIASLNKIDHSMDLSKSIDKTDEFITKYGGDTWWGWNKEGVNSFLSSLFFEGLISNAECAKVVKLGTGGSYSLTLLRDSILIPKCKLDADCKSRFSSTSR